MTLQNGIKRGCENSQLLLTEITEAQQQANTYQHQNYFKMPTILSSLTETKNMNKEDKPVSPR